MDDADPMEILVNFHDQIARFVNNEHWRTEDMLFIEMGPLQDGTCNVRMCAGNVKEMAEEFEQPNIKSSLLSYKCDPNVVFVLLIVATKTVGVANAHYMTLPKAVYKQTADMIKAATPACMLN